MKDAEMFYLELVKKVFEEIREVPVRNPGTLTRYICHYMEVLDEVSDLTQNSQVRNTYLKLVDVQDVLRSIINKKYIDIVKDLIKGDRETDSYKLINVFALNMVDNLRISNCIRKRGIVDVEYLQYYLKESLESIDESGRVEILNIISNGIEKGIKKFPEVESKHFDRVYKLVTDSKNLEELCVSLDTILNELDREALNLVRG